MMNGMKELSMNEMETVNGGSVLAIAIIGVILSGAAVGGLIYIGEDSAKKKQK